MIPRLFTKVYHRAHPGAPRSELIDPFTCSITLHASRHMRRGDALLCTLAMRHAPPQPRAHLSARHPSRPAPYTRSDSPSTTAQCDRTHLHMPVLRAPLGHHAAHRQRARKAAGYMRHQIDACCREYAGAASRDTQLPCDGEIAPRANLSLQIEHCNSATSRPLGA